MQFLPVLFLLREGLHYFSVLQATGEQIPLIVRSCIRIINLYGECLMITVALMFPLTNNEFFLPFIAILVFHFPEMLNNCILYSTSDRCSVVLL